MWKNYFKDKDFLRIIKIAAIWILAVNFFAVIVNNRVNLAPDNAYSWMDPAAYEQSDQSFKPFFYNINWDSVHYIDIAENGYSYEGKGDLANIVFFPLYPFLIFLFSFIFINFKLTAWLLSVAFLIFAAYFLVKLTKRFHKKIKLFEPVLFLLIFPAAFFLNAIYTESLFLFLSIAVFYFSFKKNFWLAGIFGLLAALTRVTGILLFVPVFMEFVKVYKLKNILNKNLIPVFFIPLGTFLFLLFHYLSFDNFLLFFEVESSWGRSFEFNESHFSFFSPASISNFILDMLYLIFALTASGLIFLKIRKSYGVYMLLTILVAVSTGTLMSIGRYILVLFPMFIWLASFKSNYLKLGWAFISILLLALNILLFVNNYWAG